MTRTTNTHRVTFSASIDCGEGYLTDRASDGLDEVLDRGWMWARDVLGDWRKYIDYAEERAIAEFAGWCDAETPGHEVAADYRSAALSIWKAGAWPDAIALTCYECGAGVDYDAADEIDSYAASDDFFSVINDEAARVARDLVGRMRGGGVQYPHGSMPSFSDLVRFYTYRELVGAGDVPARG